MLVRTGKMRVPVVFLLACLGVVGDCKLVQQQTPPLGWNSYNSYLCHPSEEIIQKNAKGLVDLGLAKLGYNLVTTDCGWPARERDAQGKLQWNSTLFPSGPTALVKYIHDLGLKAGLYSGAGNWQCGSNREQPASLGKETVDAQSFADWGGDSLKYDNCYPTSADVAADVRSDTAKSPERFQTMARALAALDHPIAYYICQWGLGENVGVWAPAMGGNTWRISNDIYNSWRSIWRITNEVIPYYKHTKPGAYADMDMLIIGLGALSFEEERFHMGMWAINKSPLIIGAPMDPNKTPAESIKILSNKAILDINQDPLGKPAQLVRRYTEEEHDIFAGAMSGGRIVLGFANWRNSSRRISVDLVPIVGVTSARITSVWDDKAFERKGDILQVHLPPHGMQIAVLDNIKKVDPPFKPAKYYPAHQARREMARLHTCIRTGECLPTGKKVDLIGRGASVTFTQVEAGSAGTKLLGVDYINYDTAVETAWGWNGTNTRNFTIAVNYGPAKRWAFPISGGTWFETGRLMIEVDGFEVGKNNSVVFAPSPGDIWAPDLVGFEVFETCLASIDG